MATLQNKGKETKLSNQIAADLSVFLSGYDYAAKGLIEVKKWLYRQAHTYVAFLSLEKTGYTPRYRYSRIQELIRTPLIRGLQPQGIHTIYAYYMPDFKELFCSYNQRLMLKKGESFKLWDLYSLLESRFIKHIALRNPSVSYSYEAHMYNQAIPMHVAPTSGELFDYQRLLIEAGKEYQRVIEKLIVDPTHLIVEVYGDVTHQNPLV